MTKAKQWAAALKAWEFAFNALMREDNLRPHEIDALFTMHDMMRTRASGVDAR